MCLPLSKCRDGGILFNVWDEGFGGWGGFKEQVTQCLGSSSLEAGLEMGCLCLHYGSALIGNL